MTDPAIPSQSASCLSCGAPVSGRYCPSCGEKQLTDRDRSLGHFLADWFELAFHFDSKFLRTMKTLLVRPGLLTTEYWNGRRIPYMKPFQLLIIINVVYYIATSIAAAWHCNITVMVPSLHDILHARVYSGWLAGVVHASRPAGTPAFDLYQRTFDDHLEHLAKSLVILLVPLAALLLKLLYVRSGKPFLYHIVASTHLVAVYIILGTTVILASGIPALRNSASPAALTALSYTAVGLLSLYMFLAFRRCYHSAPFWDAVAALLMVFAGIQIVTELYDFILFWIAFAIT
ncbi:MAG TPA: DUF3667 domain-containing protein [Bacteroidota bacterium]|nr:DUF3667 domain-containing protein [Bacteroidota bacterium]